MSEKPNPHPAEWKGNIEIVLEKASLRALSENKRRKKKPSYEQFKKETISCTPQFVSEQEEYIIGHFGKNRGEEFRICFDLAEARLEKGENEECLEKVIHELDDKLT